MAESSGNTAGQEDMPFALSPSALILSPLNGCSICYLNLLSYYSSLLHHTVIYAHMLSGYFLQINFNLFPRRTSYGFVCLVLVFGTFL